MTLVRKARAIPASKLSCVCGSQTAPSRSSTAGVTACLQHICTIGGVLPIRTSYRHPVINAIGGLCSCMFTNWLTGVTLFSHSFSHPCSRSSSWCCVTRGSR